MEYLRDYLEGNKKAVSIQAGFALHAGKLLMQYEALAQKLPHDQRYDATLTISVLQALLTNCVELLDSLQKSQSFQQDFARPLLDIPQFLGIGRSLIRKSYYKEEVTHKQILESIRNALSHPTYSTKGELSSTGYHTINETGHLISAFRFIDSPWVKRGRLMTYDDAAKAQAVIERFERRAGNFGLRPRQQNPGRKFEIALGDQTFVPIMELEIPLPNLKVITRELSNLLAQPVMEQWDAATVHQLVA